MKLSQLMVLNALVALAFGAAFVLMPARLLACYGISLTLGGILIARLFGAALLGFGTLTWLARNAAESDALRAIVLALFLGDAVGFIVALQGQLSGTVNALGWSTVALYLLFTLGYGYFQYARRSAA